MSSAVNSAQVIRLYRDLLRYGQKLKFTDQAYFRQRVKEEFKSHKNLQSQGRIEFFFKKGQTLLEQKRVL